MNASRAVFGDMDGAILVGGRSSRFGQDKVLLSIAGKPLIANLYELIQPLVREVLVVGHHRPEFDDLGFRVVMDLVPDSGPMGGLYTALMSTDARYVFVAAADMPYLSPSVIRKIAEYRGDADAVIPRGPRGLEPLCAVYSRSCTGPLHTSLEQGNRRIVNALEGLRILEPEIQAHRGERDYFFNINRPEDLEEME